MKKDRTEMIADYTTRVHRSGVHYRIAFAGGVIKCTAFSANRRDAREQFKHTVSSQVARRIGGEANLSSVLRLTRIKLAGGKSLQGAIVEAMDILDISVTDRPSIHEMAAIRIRRGVQEKKRRLRGLVMRA